LLVLASASPRRAELLRNAGISFLVHPSDVPEGPLEGGDPRLFAERLAREKASVVFLQRPKDVVLGADTVVIVGREILGKPRDEADAARMLRMLSGRSHLVTTGVCLVGPAKLETGNQKLETRFADLRSETTIVAMDRLTEEDIRLYVATNEPMDKAGAYAIQDIASRWISRIAGDYCNVVGLPIALVYRMLREHHAI